MLSKRPLQQKYRKNEYASQKIFSKGHKLIETHLLSTEKARSKCWCYKNGVPVVLKKKSSHKLTQSTDTTN